MSRLLLKSKNFRSDEFLNLIFQLTRLGFSDLFIDELVAAAVRCNYGQMPDVSPILWFNR